MRHQTARSDYGTLLWKEYQWGVDYRLYDIIDHAYKDRDASFEYDGRGYLVRAIYNRKEEQFRTPDKLGNLYETKNKTDRKYKNSQLQQDHTYYYHYDVEGNLIFKEHIKDVGYRPVFSGGELRDLGINPKSTGKGILYTWNANGSLRAVTNLEGITYRFRYDAFGRRLEKRRMSSTFRFVWDGNVLLHETFKKDNSEHTELTTWVFEGFVPTAKLVNGKAYSIMSDHLGTPIMALDSEGNEVWTRLLDIYGRVKYEYKSSSLGDDIFPFVPFLYQGQYYDFETNLAYNRYRYYSPESGMYISQDPIRLNGNNPTLYAYVKDNNIWVDRFGLDCVYQIVDKKGNVKYYGITERDPVIRGNEHIDSGNLKLKEGEKMQIIAKNVNHDQARTIEATKIREKLREKKVDVTKPILEQLDQAGLRNRNRGRDIDIKPFDPNTMGGEYSLLDEPEEVKGLKNVSCKK